MKKRISIIILAILVVSAMPMAFATGNQTNTTNASTFKERLEDRHEAFKEEAEQVRERFQETKEGIKQRREQVQKRIETAREKFANARERYEAAKERYQNAKERFKTIKERVQRARETFKECKGSDSEKCQEARQQVKANAKPYLTNSADMILEALERLHAKVNESDIDNKEAILASLDDQIAEVKEAKTVIENLNDNTTAEEIREAAQTIREAWRHTRKTMQRTAGNIVNAKLGNVIKQVEQLQTKLEKTRDKLEEQGYDVSALDASMDAFQEKLDDATTEWEAAKALYAEADDNIEEITQEAHAHVQTAKDDLKDVREMLRDIVQEIRTVNGGGDENTNETVNETA